MGTLFPGAVDILTNPTPSSSQLVLQHSKQHADVNDAVEAMQALLLGMSGMLVIPTSAPYNVDNTGVVNAIPGLTSANATGIPVYLGTGTYRVDTNLSGNFIIGPGVSFTGAGTLTGLGSFLLLRGDLFSNAVGKGASMVKFQGGKTVQDLASTASSADNGGKLVGWLAEAAGSQPTTVGERLHRDYVYVTDKAGADPTGNTDSTAAVLAAIATNKLVRLDGFFRINQSLTTPRIGIVGDGTNRSGLIVTTANHCIEIPNNVLGRRGMRLENFQINSLGNVCDGKYAIYAGGVAPGAAFSYNSGLDIYGVCIGGMPAGSGAGRFGGGIYLKDFFRVNVQDVGMTDVTQMVSIIGSTLQCKFRNVTSNNDFAGSTLLKYGIVTAAATYASGLALPENVRFADCSYIIGDRGISHGAGSDVEYHNFDAETATHGILINNQAKVFGGIVGPSPTAGGWIGYQHTPPGTMYSSGSVVSGLDVNVFRLPGTPGASYAFDFGDNVNPLYGAVMNEGCRVRGVNGGLTHAVRARSCADLTVHDSLFDINVFGGAVMQASNQQRLFVERNRVAGGVFSASDSGAAAYGAVQYNGFGVVTFAPTTPANWRIGPNG